MKDYGQPRYEVVAGIEDADAQDLSIESAKSYVRALDSAGIPACIYWTHTEQIGG